ncbi:hypothetical protein [Undibacterium flavidum]|uniref:DUF3298 domain-containing protein n=1 Tax=Undibacterium flavidum TaxID=2762297 RepID=A0ABR6YFT9_9BURK|nr:hypothetical protein [Undibacterium flavidum]MBC3875344.1 hypothetical protein [Undibacterium flavidum]
MVQVNKRWHLFFILRAMIFCRFTLSLVMPWIICVRVRYFMPQILSQYFCENTHFRSKNLITSLLFFVSISAFSSTNDKLILGAWSGTVGNDDVRVCFAGYNSNFYRVRYGKGIGLESEQKTGRNKWHILEGPYGQPDDAPRATWQVKLLDHNTLTGFRTDVKRSKSKLPIQLKRILDDEKISMHDECGIAFYTPMVQATAIKTKDASFSGKPYIVISSKYGKSFQLPDTDPNALTINAIYKKLLDEEVAASYACDIDINGARKEGWFTNTSPLVWTEEWLVVRYQFEYTCGGAHGDAPRSERIFDLKNGKQVDSWSWIKGGERAANPDREHSTALRKLLHKYGKMARVNPNVQHQGVFDLNAVGTSIENPYPTTNGLVFTTRFDVCRALACDVFITVPYAAIATHLTDEGKIMAASFKKQ